MQDMIKEDRFFLQTLILHGAAPLAGERTIQSFYYILQGRKANQAYQDVQLFRLHPYYRLFPALSKEKWNEIVQQLASSGCISFSRMDEIAAKLTFLITDTGKGELQRGIDTYDLNNWLAPLQGQVLVPLLEEFWLRLHLMVQTLSHLLERDMNFLPMVSHKRIHDWVKRQLASQASREIWMQGLSGELLSLLGGLAEPLQRLLLWQWSGARQSGRTYQQIAYETGQPPSFLHVQTLSAAARLYSSIQSDAGQRYPLMQCLAGRSESHLRLSGSAAETYKLLLRGLNVQQISTVRKVKVNTIEDHLVEIALHCPDWDYREYLRESDREAILDACRALNTRRLRLIKNHFGDMYTYLQIRLALSTDRKEDAG